MRALHIALSLAACLILGAPALADEPIRPDRRPPPRQRERPDDHRDMWGPPLRFGHLSPAERRRVLEQEEYIAWLERAAREDGYYSRSERVRIFHARQDLERMILRLRTDDDRR